MFELGVIKQKVFSQKQFQIYFKTKVYQSQGRKNMIPYLLIIILEVFLHIFYLLIKIDSIIFYMITV